MSLYDRAADGQANTDSIGLLPGLPEQWPKDCHIFRHRLRLQLLTNREKTMLVDALRPSHAVKELLAALGLARRSYFTATAGCTRRCYGCASRSEKVVRRLMKQENLVANRAASRATAWH